MFKTGWRYRISTEVYHNDSRSIIKHIVLTFVLFLDLIICSLEMLTFYMYNTKTGNKLFTKVFVAWCFFPMK